MNPWPGHSTLQVIVELCTISLMEQEEIPTSKDIMGVSLSCTKLRNFPSLAPFKELRVYMMSNTNQALWWMEKQYSIDQMEPAEIPISSKYSFLLSWYQAQQWRAV